MEKEILILNPVIINHDDDYLYAYYKYNLIPDYNKLQGIINFKLDVKNNDYLYEGTIHIATIQSEFIYLDIRGIKIIK